LSYLLLVAASACATGDREDPITTMTADEIAVSSHARVCTQAGPGEASCHARVLVNAGGDAVANATPAGLGPSQLRDAYKITSTGSSTTVMAIVDAFGYPTAESDLATYRSTFGLPPCTTANGCFRKVSNEHVRPRIKDYAVSSRRSLAWSPT
jgi:hypothetical protein